MGVEDDDDDDDDDHAGVGGRSKAEGGRFTYTSLTHASMVVRWLKPPGGTLGERNHLFLPQSNSLPTTASCQCHGAPAPLLPKERVFAAQSHSSKDVAPCALQRERGASVGRPSLPGSMQERGFPPLAAP